MNRGVWIASGAGGVLGLIGLVLLLVNGIHQIPGWAFVAGCFLVLFLAQISAVQQAIEQREEARLSRGGITQKFMHMGEGASLGSSQISDITMRAGVERVYSERKRRRSRRLSKGQRCDLADRCEATSKEALEWLKRVSPTFGHTWDEEQRQEHESVERAHQNVTEQGFFAKFAPRLRDLLNEAVEAGYSLDDEMERLRLDSHFTKWDMDGLAQAVGIVGLRVRRESKKL